MGIKNIKVIVLLSSFILLSCSSSPVNLYGDKADISLGLPSIRLSEKETTEFKKRLDLAKVLLKQYRELAEIKTAYDSLKIDSTLFPIQLAGGKKPSIALGSLYGSDFKTKLLLTKEDSLWSYKLLKSAVRLEEAHLKYYRIMKRWEWVDPNDSLHLFPFELNGDTSKTFFIPLSENNKGTLGGVKVATKDSVLSLGEINTFDKREVRHFNFQVANGQGSVPAISDLFEALKYQEYFPTHYLHTGKYIFGLVPDKKKLGNKMWIVLDPTKDDRYKILRTVL